MTAPTRFPFAVDPAAAPLLLPFGVTSRTAEVLVGRSTFVARFGWLSLSTERSNVVDATAMGPLKWWRAIGPRMSAADTGLTFGTSSTGGVCVRFREPVPGLLGRLRPHEALTVTVADPVGLVAALSS